MTIDELTAQELLRAASFFQVYELQIRIEKFLADRITITNVVELLSLANECRADDLRRVCIPYLMKNMHAVVQFDSFDSYQEWVSQEILLELANTLGPVWYNAYVDVMTNENEPHARPRSNQRPRTTKECITTVTSSLSSVSTVPITQFSEPARKRMATRSTEKTRGTTTTYHYHSASPPLVKVVQMPPVSSMSCLSASNTRSRLLSDDSSIAEGIC